MTSGTPNSGFSTTAIKDGHQGAIHPNTHHGHSHTLSADSNSSTNTLDAERADRISRLAGLERVATLRGASQHGNPQQPFQQQVQPQQQVPLGGYFDANAERYKSTVGSASATGSAGGRGTWASGSASDLGDRMSEGPDPEQEGELGDGVSSVGLSDGGDQSLVGFGEGAGSTVSGPTSGGGGGAPRRFGAVRVGEDAQGVSSPPVGKQMEGSPMETD